MTPRYRVAVLAETFPPTSGGVPAAQFGMAELLGERHDVRLFAFEDSRPSDSVAFRSNGLGAVNRTLAAAASMFVRRHDGEGGSAQSQRIAATVPAVLKINRELARFKPDFIFVPDFCVPALALSKPNGARMIWTAHHNYRRFEGNPLVPTSGWYDTFIAHRLEIRGLKRCDHVIFPSRYMERVFRETFDTRLPGTVIPNVTSAAGMCDLKRSAARQALALPPDAVLVYVPSGGSSPKGERYTFEIVRRLLESGGDIRFFISGPMDERLRFELSNGFSPNHFITPGQLPLSENLKIVAASDVVVSPTLMENYSCALLEAQLLGLPCVTFDTGGNSELISDGVTGFVVPYLDVELLVRKSSTLVHDALLRATMSEAAKAHAVRISNPAMLLPLYEQVMESSVNSTKSGE